MNKVNISFEFFPPKTQQGVDALSKVRQRLQSFNPKYYSVTYGAGGTTQSYTHSTVQIIYSEGLTEVAPHISCVGATSEELDALLQGYLNLGARRLVALRGDLPSGMADLGDYRYAADLVRFIRKHSGDDFHISVAAYPEMHPQAKNLEQDIEHFCDKVKAGANAAITQYFFNVDAYWNFVESCHKRQIDVPIIPGIMPIINFEKLVLFSKSCGTEVPQWLQNKMHAYKDDKASIQAFGEEFVTRLCEKLIGQGVQELHFYTMNQSDPVAHLCKNLNLDRSA